jgi:hypothetical protein
MNFQGICRKFSIFVGLLRQPIGCRGVEPRPCAFAHFGEASFELEAKTKIIAAEREAKMDLQTDERNGERTVGHLAMTDVVYVALAIAVILFGNMALVRAMDVALDSLVR